MRASSDLDALRAKLGITAGDAPRLAEALTHGSVNQTGGPPMEKNERLAFLGDAVIELAVRHDLFNADRGAPRGELSIKADDLVANKRLAKMAESFGLVPYIDLGKGAQDARARESVLATALEAVIGAVFVEKGFPAAAACALRIIKP